VTGGPARGPGGPRTEPDPQRFLLFDAQQRRFALLAHALAGRPLRLEPCGLPVDAARLPPAVATPGTVRVPADPGRAVGDEDAVRMLRLGVLREALRANDPPPRGPAWRQPERAVLERRVLALLERARIDAMLYRRCPGAAPELAAAAARALARRANAPAPARSEAGVPARVRAIVGALAREVLGAPRAADRDPRSLLGAVLEEVPPLREARATAADARAAARRIVARLVAATGRRPGDGDLVLIDALEPVTGLPAPAGLQAGSSAGRGTDGPPGDVDGDGSGVSPDGGELLRAGAPAGGRGAEPAGAVVVEPADAGLERDAFGRPSRPRPMAAPPPPPGGTLVDEWDSINGRMLRAWCRVVETRLRGTRTGFLDEVRGRHPALWDELRRRLARTPATGRRRIRGVGDGDELDLDGMIASVLDRRAGRASDEHAYARRDPVVRDVAAAFLADLSASTAVALPEARPAARDDAAAPTDGTAAWVDSGALLYGVYDDDPPAAPAPARRRVVDLEKEALALMAAVLDRQGDTCALWGFSGDGRDRVDFLVAKDFSEPASPSTWAALAAMEPRGSTRMGAAIRHAVAKLRREPASRRLLVVVSDGYPQDSDYGPDRLDVEYGIRDTARALADAEREGVATCCVTVDPAGHDYLRRMCPPHRYRVIEDLPQLPAVLAEVYASLAGRRPS
jgi:nitric oxide reductase NorD protein